MLTLTNLQIAVAVVVVTLITFACRIAPFALLRGRSTSPLLGFLSSAMPLGVMVVLVAYTLGDVGTTPAAWLLAVAGIAATAGLHLWRRAIGLSLIGGTGTYVVISLPADLTGSMTPPGRLERECASATSTEIPRIFLRIEVRKMRETAVRATKRR